MKIKLLISFLVIVFLTGTAFALDRNRKVEPVIGAQPVLTKSLYNQTLGMDPTSRRLVYVLMLPVFWMRCNWILWITG